MRAAAGGRGSRFLRDRSFGHGTVKVNIPARVELEAVLPHVVRRPGLERHGGELGAHDAGHDERDDEADEEEHDEVAPERERGSIGDVIFAELAVAGKRAVIVPGGKVRNDLITDDVPVTADLVDGGARGACNVWLKYH